MDKQTNCEINETDYPSHDQLGQDQVKIGYMDMKRERQKYSNLMMKL
jgi:hypothetical protein